MFKQTLKPTITKRYQVPRQEFKANSPVNFASSDIGMNPEKLACPPVAGKFASVSSNHGFIYSMYYYVSYDAVTFVTNLTQYLQFEIVWQEYI